MTGYIALLRAVNLGGSTQVSMSTFADVLTRGGFKEVQTILQSGNLVFRTEPTRTDLLERRLEAHLHAGLGKSTEIFVRSAAEWREIVTKNPFPTYAEVDPGHLLLTVLKAEPTQGAWSGLRAAIRGREEIRESGRQAYIVYPDGIGRSRLTAALIERKLETQCTSRNWNTVNKLERLASA